MSPLFKNKAAYAQLSSSQTQRPASTSPVVVTFDLRDGLVGIGHSTDAPGDIKILEDGVYFIMAAGQIGRESGALIRFVDLWLRQDGKDMPNSNVRGATPSKLFFDDTYVLVTQAVAPFRDGSVINVMMSVSADVGGLGLTATSPKDEPMIPSVIFSMFKVGN